MKSAPGVSSGIPHRSMGRRVREHGCEPLARDPSLTDSRKFVAEFVTVATVEPDCCRALKYVDSMSAFTATIPASDAPWTARPTCHREVDRALSFNTTAATPLAARPAGTVNTVRNVIEKP